MQCTKVKRSGFRGILRRKIVIFFNRNTTFIRKMNYKVFARQDRYDYLNSIKIHLETSHKDLSTKLHPNYCTKKN